MGLISNTLRTLGGWQNDMMGVSTNNAFNAEEAQKNRDWQERMANTAYQRMVADMEAAGLNPIYGLSAGGATTPSGGAASATSGAGGQQTASMISAVMTGGAALMNSKQGAEKLGSEIEKNQATAEHLRTTAWKDRELTPTQKNEMEKSAQNLETSSAVNLAKAKNLNADTQLYTERANNINAHTANLEAMKNLAEEQAKTEDALRGYKKFESATRSAKNITGAIGDVAKPAIDLFTGKTTEKRTNEYTDIYGGKNKTTTIKKKRTRR